MSEALKVVVPSLPAILVMVVALIALLVQGHRNAKRSQKDFAAISAKADQIHELTNSRMSDMDRKLAASADTIRDLEKILQAWRDLKPVDPDHAPETRHTMEAKG